MANEVWYVSKMLMEIPGVLYIDLMTLPEREALQKARIYEEIRRNSMVTSLVTALLKTTQIREMRVPLEERLKELAVESERLEGQYGQIHGPIICRAVQEKKARKYAKGQIILKP
jgi:hypothetical protein